MSSISFLYVCVYTYMWLYVCMNEDEISMANKVLKRKTLIIEEKVGLYAWQIEIDRYCYMMFTYRRHISRFIYTIFSFLNVVLHEQVNFEQIWQR